MAARQLALAHKDLVQLAAVEPHAAAARAGVDQDFAAIHLHEAVAAIGTAHRLTGFHAAASL
jgi:hypothetical protein